MVWFALSFQDQVEKYGAYVGIAAFFGLAVLSLLYFSQARELKRLREWAGRAPERAQELEQRVVAQASAARRGPAMPAAAAAGAVAPPRRLAEMPAPPREARPAEGSQATELADAVPEEPATNGKAPPPSAGPGGSVPAGTAADPASGNGGALPAPAPADDGTATPEGEASTAPGPSPDDTAAARADESAPADAEAEDAPHPSEAVPSPVSGERPPASTVPRATPAQRVGVTPRPTPLPLRQAKPSAVPPSQRGARRPSAPAPAAPAREGRSAGTVALLVGLAVLLLGGGTFLASQLLGGDDDPAPPNQAAPPSTQTENGADEASDPSPPAETTVAVLNATNFTGLAGQIADRVAEEGGYQRGITETNTRDQTLQASTVYFGDGFRGSARAVARMLSIDDVQSLDDETAALAPDADVVVLAGADQAP